MAQEATAKAKKPKKVRVTPTAETNKLILSKFSRTIVDVAAVQQHYNCNRNDAIVLAAAAENNMLPTSK